MASPAFSFCAAVENSVQMLFIEIETDPYTATRLTGNDLEIRKLTYGTRKELFQIRLRDIPDLLAVIINADGGISLAVVNLFYLFRTKYLTFAHVAFIIKCERANKLRRTYFFTQKRRRGYEIRVLKARGAADYRGNVRKGRKAGRDCRACRQVPSDHIPRARARQDRGNGLPLSSRV